MHGWMKCVVVGIGTGALARVANAQSVDSHPVVAVGSLGFGRAVAHRDRRASDRSSGEL
jgi:hypothetical protein